MLNVFKLEKKLLVAGQVKAYVSQRFAQSFITIGLLFISEKI